MKNFIDMHVSASAEFARVIKCKIENVEKYLNKKATHNTRWNILNFKTT